MTLTVRNPVHVHISNLAAQTGASLFLQTHARPEFPFTPAITHGNWTYDKTESLRPRDLAAATGITHLISEFRPEEEGWSKREWSVVESVRGYEKWVINLDALKGKYKGDLVSMVGALLQMEVTEKLWIVEKTIGE